MWKLNQKHSKIINELQKKSKGKIEDVPLPHSIHKNELKMEHRPNCKS